MFTDMVGSTSAAQEDETRALKVRQEQQRLLRPIFAAHQGREVKSMGDGFMVEFDSALQGVQCALEIQQALHERNLSASEAGKIRLRIGIHLGDVVHEGDDVVGDSVNIASRIEALAEPGGICITDPVFGQVRNKIPNRLERLEPKMLKNVRFPIDTYRVVLPWDAHQTNVLSPGQIRLAVLPFSSISPDPKDEYFADGLTEEVITVISQLRDLQVIARTSVIPYKSSSKSVAQIGAELGVTSILEGSVRKAGSRLRITAQLIDAGSEAHVWAKAYDRELDDVFVVQSDIARSVAEALKVELHAPEKQRFDARKPVQTESYLAYLKGQTLMHDPGDVNLKLAQEQFELAIKLDASNAAAYSGLAIAIRQLGTNPDGGPRVEWDERSRQLASRAIELDPNLAQAHVALGGILSEDYEHAAAVKELELAISLNPSDARAHRWLAFMLLEQKRAEEAIAQLRLAEAADPLSTFTLYDLAWALTWLGRRAEAWATVEKLKALNPSPDYFLGALAWYHLGGSDEAQTIKALNEWHAALPSPDSRDGEILRAWIWACTGEIDKAKARLKVEETLPEVPQLCWEVAVVYAQVGDLDGAFRWFNKAIDNHMVWLSLFRYFPRLETMRQDPRFQAALRRANLG